MDTRAQVKVIVDGYGERTIGRLKRHVLALGPYTRDWDPSDPPLDLETEATAEVEVLPADPAEMGRVVDGIGQRMFGADADDYPSEKRPRRFTTWASQNRPFFAGTL